MSPRAYRLGRRQESADQTRARILAAARRLLATRDGWSHFTIDAAAKRAGVARMTVYHQFGSKTALLEALFDDLAARGLVGPLREAFGRPTALEALDGVIAAFAHFWSSDRAVLRRIRSLAGIDPDFERSVRARDLRRRNALTALLARLASERVLPARADHEELVVVLNSLTSFESFDALAGPDRSPMDVAPLVQRLARTVLALDR